MSIIALAISIVFALSNTAFAAGGSEKKTTLSADRLATADRLYNEGLKHRDKAWEYEKQAKGVSGSDRSTYLNSAEREFGRAIEKFKLATKENSRLYQAFSSLGYCQRKTGKYEDALKSYDRALRMASAYAEAIEYRAEANILLGRLRDALSDYDRLVKLDQEKAKLFLAVASDWLKGREVTGEEMKAFSDRVASESKRMGPPAASTW